MDPSSWTAEEVLKWVHTTEELRDKCTIVCGELTSQRYDISHVVEKLGPILTHAEAEKRRAGVLFLTQLLSQLPDNFLTTEQLKFILTFYRDRLRDHHSLVPTVLAGVHTLVQMTNAAEEDVLGLLLAILSGSIITCQSQQREERSRIFDVLIFCSDKYKATLTQRRSEYIQGVINAIEGERDPRNLVKLFDFVPRFVQQYPLEHWADEMFEVFACYYPIDFYPSANDPNAITRDGLAEKLDRCLLGCREFIEAALVLALEKLETDLKVAKLDSLALIRNCAQRFGSKEIEEKFDSVWMGLKQELLPGQNDDVIRAGLETVAVILREAKEEPVLANLLTVLFNSIAISLCDVNLRLFYPALRVATAAAGSRPEAAVYIANKVIPIFLRQLRDCDETEQGEEKKRSLYGLLKDVVSVANEKRCLSSMDRETLAEVEAVFVSLLVQEQPSAEEEEGSTKVIGFLGLLEICEETQRETRNIIYASLLQALRSGSSGRIPVTACVTRLVGAFQQELIDELVRPVISADTQVSEKNCQEIFGILCTLLGPCQLDDEDIYRYLLRHIFSFPEGASLNLNDESEGDHHSRILLVLLTALDALLQRKENAHVARKLQETHNLVHLLMQARDKFRGDFILYPLSTLLMHVVSCGAQSQSKAIETYLPQLKVSASNDLYFIRGLLSRCSNEVSLDSAPELASDLVRPSLVEGNATRVRVCHHLLCFLFNRNYSEDGACFDRALATVEQSMEQTGHGIQTLAWITKGLLTRGHPKAEGLILKLIASLKDPQLSSSAADAFECLAQDSEVYLPNRRLFYKQKLFDLVCQTLLVSDAALQLDAAQLKALIRVLGELSPVVLRMRLVQIGPILFRCLEHTDPRTVHTTLQLFFRLIETDPSYCQEHMQFLLPQFLKLSQFTGNLHIRILSLKCLLAVCNKFPAYLLIPLKQDVLFGLVPALDDHKRLVRAAAVEARTKWFLIDAPIKEK